MALNTEEREESLAILERLRPLDDDFMRVMFRDKGTAEVVLRIIMGKDDLQVTDCHTQEDMRRLAGARSICLDALATDADGKKYNIEVQRAIYGAKPKRARYHASVMDIEFLDKNDDFDRLPECYVIFITEKDTMGDGEAIHVFERLDLKTSKPLNDEQHVLYINGAYVGSEKIGMLMHDFRCSSASDMLIPEIAERTRYLKETPEGVEIVCQLMEERIYRKEIEFAKKLIAMGVNTLEQIAEASGLTLEKVRELANQKAC